MEIKQKQSKYPLVVLAILLLVGSAAATYYTIDNRNDESQNTSTDNPPPTEEQVTDGQNTKKDTIDSGGKPDITNDTPNDDTDANIPLTVSTINQTDSALQIRVIIDRIIASGSCTLLLTKDSSTVTKTVELAAMPSSSTCKGFDVKNSELSQGAWQYQITVTSGRETGVVRGTTEVE